MKKKVALITGASQGIGAAIAYRLNQDGLALALVDINLSGVQKLSDKINKDGGTSVAIKADVSNKKDFYNAIDVCVDKLNDLNILINNAGIAPTGSILDVKSDDLINTMNINVGGTIWGIQSATKKFKQLKHGGKIINASSQAGVTGNENLTIYGASKFAIRGITQTAAQELASLNITVNAFCPGIVETPMMKNIAKKVADDANKSFEWGMKQYSKNITLKKLAQPSDVASCVSFLASSDSDYMTGQSLLIDGGMVFN